MLQQNSTLTHQLRSLTTTVARSLTFSELSVVVRLLLVAGVVVIFGRTVVHGYSCFDDPSYVAGNAHVAAGINLQGVMWAFTTGELSNWHPLTWLSLMLDAELFGARPAAFHAVNVLLHAAVAVLLFDWLCQLLLPRRNDQDKHAGVETTRVWIICAAFVGTAVWAFHPLRVESVAWISQRKDLLSGLFGLLALRALGRTWPEVTWAQVGRAAIFFGLGLMAKPTIITLPVTFALLVWCWTGRIAWQKTAPLLAIAAVSAAITLHVQQVGGAMDSMAGLTLMIRVGNAMASIAAYLGQTCVPVNQSIFYPYHKPPPAWAMILGVMAVSVWFWCFVRIVRVRLSEDAFAFSVARTCCAGLGFFLLALAPMLGLVQVGEQARADRYTYWPSIGLALAIAWLLSKAPRGWLRPLAAFTVAVLAALGVLAYCQTRRWRSEEVLLVHSLAVSGDSHVLHNNLGAWLVNAGRLQEAESHFEAAVAVLPEPHTYVNLASIRLRTGKVAAADQALRQSLALSETFAPAWALSGICAGSSNDWVRAAMCFRRALEIDPKNADARNGLATALSKENRHL